MGHISAVTVNLALVLACRRLKTEQTTLKFYLRPVEGDERVEACKATRIVVSEESLNVSDTCDVTRTQECNGICSREKSYVNGRR